MWPFPKSEARQADSYTDLVVGAIERQASGARGSPQALAAVEAAANMCESAFAAARVLPANAMLNPFVLAIMGRAYVLRGEAVFAIVADDMRLALVPCAAWDITGGSPDPRAWRYRCDLAGPSGRVTRVLPGDGVVHVRWHVDPARPWAGRSPLHLARLSAEVAAAAETSMQDEFKIKPTRIVPTPSGNKEQVRETTDQIRKGGIRGIAWARQATELRADPKPELLGPAPGDGAVSVRRSAAVEVAAACGIPPPLIDATAAGQGQREAYRRFALLTIAPALRIAAAEIAAKLEVPGLRLDVGALGAIDLISRARAVQVLVAAGFETEAAARAAGVLNLPDGEA